MARFKDAEVTAAIGPHLQPGERLRHWAYGVRQPHLLLIILLTPLATALLTKEYVVALTDRRLLVLRTGRKLRVEGLTEYRLDQRPPAKTSTGALFTHIRIEDAAKPFAAKFHRLGMANNREHAMAIAAALGGAD
ncbi:MAG: hypothetical protein LC795_21165 [Acidobacteria bacterium]|nr:hypothetical protein [Acidobacteriota bacterium]